METEVKLTKLAQCAGCGAKVGAGTLAKLLDGIPTRSDERLLVGFDKSDDASVYKIDENTALVQTLDFFPPIVDDPEMFGEIAAVNAISEIWFICFWICTSSKIFDKQRGKTWRYFNFDQTVRSWNFNNISKG